MAKYTEAGSEAEAELAVERLFDKLHGWMMQQPELLFIWSQDRYTRRRVSEMIAKELVTIPTRRIDDSTPPNRAFRRAIVAEMKKADPEWWTGVAGLEGGKL
jgi:hypothetical protein